MSYLNAGKSIRCKQLLRILPMIFLLSKRGYTARQLAERFNVGKKTIYRDLEVFDAVGIPLYTEPFYPDNSDSPWVASERANLYRIDSRWANQFIKK